MIVLLTAFYIFIQFLILLVCVLFLYFKYRFGYWKRRNVPSLPTKFIFGNLENPLVMTKHIGVQLKEIYDNFKQNGHSKYGGIYILSKPWFLFIDPNVYKHVFGADNFYFTDRDTFMHPKQFLTKHLANLNGQEAKDIRNKLTPMFTNTKLKAIFSMISKVGSDMVIAINKKVGKGYVPLNIREYCTSYSIDMIGLIAFGIESNNIENKNTEFNKFCHRIMNHTIMEQIRRTFIFHFKNLAKLFNVQYYSRDVSDFFKNFILDLVQYRESNGIRRNDLFDTLLDLKNGILQIEHSDGKLDMDTFMAQAYMFLVSGEVFSLTILFCLSELAIHLDIQEKARNEIREVMSLNNGQLTYDSLKDLIYLQQIMEETLRKHPQTPLLSRKCVRNYQVPDSDVIIEKGTVISIPIYAIHRDSDIYDDPDKFDPERFNKDEKNKRLPHTFIPWGGGSRICIAMRLVYLELKIALALLLYNFEFQPNIQTKIPLEISNSDTLLKPRGDVWFNVRKIS